MSGNVDDSAVLVPCCDQFDYWSEDPETSQKSWREVLGFVPHLLIISY